MGDEADWNSVDALMLKVLAAAEKVARYRHAQLSAMRLSGDLNARPENCEPRRAAGEHQGGVDYGWAAYRHGTRAAGVENGGRLDRGE
jgi:hypothetical protein